MSEEGDVCGVCLRRGMCGVCLRKGCVWGLSEEGMCVGCV